MKLKITRTDATLGAVISDISLAKLDNIAWRIIEDAFHEYAVLIFPNQHLSGDEQVAFAERFGEIEYLVSNAKIVPISNQRPDGKPIPVDNHRSQVMRGNEGWHTDSSYMPLAAKASALSASRSMVRSTERKFPSE